MDDYDIELIQELCASDTGFASAVHLPDENNTPQIIWGDGKFKNSITVFRPEDVAEMKRVSFSMNEVVWIGNVRFTRTSL